MRRNTKWGIILVVIGIVLQLNNLEIIERIATYWPLLLILAGILMLFEREKSSSSTTE